MPAALITGASGGIGSELARVFAAHQIDVLLSARSEDRLQALAAELRDTYGCGAEVYPVDLATGGAATQLHAAVAAAGHSVDYLVNNAGFGTHGVFAETDWATEADMLGVNIVALTELTKCFVPAFVQRGHGRILNVASTAAFQPGPYMAVYFATKAYVLSFSEALAAELRGTGVTVTALCPGATATDFIARADAQGTRVFGRKLPTAAAVAGFGFAAMQRGRRVAVHGLGNRILVQSIRFAPRSLVAAIARRLMSKE